MHALIARREYCGWPVERIGRGTAMTEDGIGKGQGCRFRSQPSRIGEGRYVLEKMADPARFELTTSAFGDSVNGHPSGIRLPWCFRDD